MRGIVYRLGRRRTGSVLLAVAAVMAIALGSLPGPASAAAAKKPPSAIAHAAGHKIA
jgi:hypothetical protein